MANWIDLQNLENHLNMKTLFNENEYFNEDYYERGAETGKSLYSHYRWMPELTIPMAHHIVLYTKLLPKEKILDFVKTWLNSNITDELRAEVLKADSRDLLEKIKEME